MTNNEIIELLSNIGIRPTATRILIYKYIHEATDTFSLGDIEKVLLSIDKSTIFRTLILFQEHHLIHSIEDGSGAMKYCLCRTPGETDIDDQHCHFYCEKCHKTYCLDSHIELNIPLPQGFTMNQVNFIVKGVCAVCSSQNQ